MAGAGVGFVWTADRGEAVGAMTGDAGVSTGTVTLTLSVATGAVFGVAVGVADTIDAAWLSDAAFEWSAGFVEGAST
ncbi:hypothetical protein LC1917_0280 [Lacticaseibacillus paracasei NRIC 1917]|uniref:Uncharacterized protein n=1 Tax=Lacticaseibacillus paracasei NRIC 0644 TaxID=1435038 RepID=A0A0C9QDZ3_LACPA|nr:hypothetical protein LC0644_2586 [Lacticaseibacillus paracasei NRIC 0644]GAN38403.1 hypothetical protein LC1917_0280 [Lacticaseibacillus paracasei NRIC 1917]